MKKICLKEYDYLKLEIKEVKTWINRYIGYVIGVSGISAVVAKYLITPHKTDEERLSDVIINPFFSPVLVLVSLIIITFLFDILWYKFKSHNRLAGYMQLLSQEIELFELTEEIRNDKEKEYVKNPKNLTPINNHRNFFKDEHEDIITWEFFMARLNSIPNNITIKETRTRIKKATKDARYIFKIPKEYNPKKLDDRFKRLDTSFYKNCIIPIFFGTERKSKLTAERETEIETLIEKDKTFFNKIKNNYLNFLAAFFFILIFCFDYLIFRSISLIFFLMLFVFSIHDSKFKNFKQFFKNVLGIFSANKKMKHVDCKIDDKYMTYGWRYPIKLIRLAILTVAGLSYSFFFCIKDMYKINYDLSELYFGNTFTLGTLLVLVWIMVILRWVCRYIGKSHQLINGKHSIEYYCWQFFIFRIQYLNEKNILPMYYSRNFIRFYKSNFIIKEIEDGKYGYSDNIQAYKESLIHCREFSEKEKTIHNLIKKERDKNKKVDP